MWPSWLGSCCDKPRARPNDPQSPNHPADPAASGVAPRHEALVALGNRLPDAVRLAGTDGGVLAHRDRGLDHLLVLPLRPFSNLGLFHLGLSRRLHQRPVQLSKWLQFSFTLSPPAVIPSSPKRTSRQPLLALDFERLPAKASAKGGRRASSHPRRPFPLRGRCRNLARRR